MTKIGFIYYTFYPVSGGASVHGINLARGLSRLGYELHKLNGDPDPWTVRLSGGPSGLFRIFKDCDLIYVRMDHFITQPRNLIGIMALLSGKKVVVELNNPSDELHLAGRGRCYIRLIDKLYRRLLRRAEAVIVVSEPLKTYCKEALGLTRLHVIENGGEVFDPSSLTPSDEVRRKMETIRNRFETVVIWAGSANEMQELEWVGEIARSAGPDVAVVFVVKDENEHSLRTGPAEGDPPERDTVFRFRNLDREDVQFLIGSSDVGLAFYKSYPWSRWGFYNSSLKIYEFLNNGLLTLTNVQGTNIQKRYPNFQTVNSPEEAIEWIQKQDQCQNRERGLNRDRDLGRERELNYDGDRGQAQSRDENRAQNLEEEQGQDPYQLRMQARSSARIRNIKESHSQQVPRTWDQAAEETAAVIEDVLKQ